LPYDLALLLVPIFILLDSFLSGKSVKKNFNLVFVILLFLLPVARHFVHGYHLSFAMLFVGLYYLYSEKHWENILKSFVVKIKRRT